MSAIKKSGNYLNPDNPSDCMETYFMPGDKVRITEKAIAGGEIEPDGKTIGTIVETEFPSGLGVQFENNKGNQITLWRWEEGTLEPYEFASDIIKEHRFNPPASTYDKRWPDYCEECDEHWSSDKHHKSVCEHGVSSPNRRKYCPTCRDNSAAHF
jgi:hypothetical protein